MQKAVPSLQFHLPDALTGKALGPMDFPNQKLLVLIFTCNHCPYAIAYEQRLVELAEKWSTFPVQFLAINANDAIQYPLDSFEQMTIRAQQRGFSFPYLHDEDQSVAHAFGAERTPEAFVIAFTPEPAVIYWGAIDDHYPDAKGVTQRYLDDAIAAGINQQTPNPMRTQPIGCSIKWKKP